MTPTTDSLLPAELLDILDLIDWRLMEQRRGGLRAAFAKAGAVYDIRSRAHDSLDCRCPMEMAFDVPVGHFDKTGTDGLLMRTIVDAADGRIPADGEYPAKPDFTVVQLTRAEMLRRIQEGTPPRRYLRTVTQEHWDKGVVARNEGREDISRSCALAQAAKDVPDFIGCAGNHITVGSAGRSVRFTDRNNNARLIIDAFDSRSTPPAFPLVCDFRIQA